MKLCDKHSEQQGAFTFADVKNNTIKSNIKLIEIYEDTQNRITLIKQRACEGRWMGVNKKKSLSITSFLTFLFFICLQHTANA